VNEKDKVHQCESCLTIKYYQFRLVCRHVAISKESKVIERALRGWLEGKRKPWDLRMPSRFRLSLINVNNQFRVEMGLQKTRKFPYPAGLGPPPLFLSACPMSLKF